MFVNRTYSKVGFIKIFQIKSQIQKMKQSTSSITNYYNNLWGLLAELDLYQNLEMESATNTKKLRNLLEMERVFQFLLGLNYEFDRVCNHVLSRQPFPDLDEAFTLLRSAQNQQELLSSKQTNYGKHMGENSALAGSKNYPMPKKRWEMMWLLQETKTHHGDMLENAR